MKMKYNETTISRQDWGVINYENIYEREESEYNDWL